MRRMVIKKLVDSGEWDSTQNKWVMSNGIKLQPNHDYMIRITDELDYVDTYYVCPDYRGYWTVSCVSIDDKNGYMMCDNINTMTYDQSSGPVASTIEVFSLTE